MDSNKSYFSNLLDKYFNNNLSAEEYSEFWKLLKTQANETVLTKDLEELWKTSKIDASIISDSEWNDKMQERKRLVTEITEHQTTTKKDGVIKRLKLHPLAVAAAIFAVVLATALFFNKSGNQEKLVKNTESKPKEDRMPGGDKAVLTLANGTKIVLDNAGNGIVANQGGTEVIKKQDGQLYYATNGENPNSIQYNLLETPKGGQYKIILPDGSKVWLNAASTIKYPVAFVGDERKVIITGEAYFEVAKNPKMPFKVQVNKMEVEVLGTHFNVKGYADEELVKTTLLEGKVKINTPNENKYLAVGQQAQFKPTGGIKIVNDVDLEETVAWKEGNFQFENSEITDVMRQLARWYDVEIEYNGKSNKHFIGNISRNVKLSQVLTMLQQTSGVKFSVQGKKIIVMP